LLLPESASVKGKPRKREVVFSWRLPEWDFEKEIKWARSHQKRRLKAPKDGVRIDLLEIGDIVASQDRAIERDIVVNEIFHDLLAKWQRDSWNFADFRIAFWFFHEFHEAVHLYQGHAESDDLSWQIVSNLRPPYFWALHGWWKNSNSENRFSNVFRVPDTNDPTVIPV
jgi:hypothetical protein